MSEQKSKELPKTETTDVEKKGFFARIVHKIDGAMKEKADQKSAKGGCCGGDDKGGKCC